MFQIMEQPQPEKTFHDQYAFFSSTSRYMEAHFEKFANAVMGQVLADRPDPFVVKLGSNDGIMRVIFSCVASAIWGSSSISGRKTMLRDDINNALKEAMKAKNERRHGGKRPAIARIHAS
jgi:hypothetical protein